MGKWIDLTPDLTEKGLKELMVGQVLMFRYEGSETHLKIMRKHKGKVWAKETYLYRPEEVKIVDKVEK